MSVRFSSLVLLVGAVGLSACSEATKADDPEVLGENGALGFWPPEAGQGTTFDARITAGRSIFRFDATDLALEGSGVTVNSFTVQDGWNATANLTVADDAALEPRDATITTSEGALTLPDALRIVPDSLTLEPARARIGETVEVEIVGNHTAWEPGMSWAAFGEGIDVLDVDVLSDSFALATVTVRRDATPGLRDVRVTTGAAATTRYDGFQVDRVALSALFDPANATQGETVEFTVFGSGTHFDEDTELTFWKDGYENGDVVIDSLTVIDPENLWGRMTVSNAAELGGRDVLLRTADEGVFIDDAFTIDGADLDLGNVAISLSFNVVRGIDNSTGAISERVSGSAVFFLALDPACPNSPEAYACGDGDDNDADGFTDCYDNDCASDPSCSSGPQPYDNNGVFPTYETGGSSDCPNPITVGAGEHVWFESPCNIVTLDRQVDAATGMIYYSAPLTLEDYCFDQLYDLHTQGEDGGIGEYLLEGVQPTVPADFEMLTPGWWGDFTQSRAADLTYTWTPAQTYPDAFFVTQISGTLVETGEGGFIGSLPWDDGEHTYTAAELSQMESGPVSFAAISMIPEGPAFGFPFSTIQSNKSSTYVYVGGSLVLE